MKAYIKSTIGTNNLGTIGKGWQDSALIAKRENVPVKVIDDLFKKLIASGQATVEVEENKTAKTATTKKAATAKTATKKAAATPKATPKSTTKTAGK